MKAAVGDIQSFSKLDFDFHVTLARSTGKEMIPEMVKWILEKVCLNLVTTEVIRMMPDVKLPPKPKTKIESESTAINKPPSAV